MLRADVAPTGVATQDTRQESHGVVSVERLAALPYTLQSTTKSPEKA